MNLAPARRSGFLILIIVLAALALRIAAVLPDSLHHPDEIGQYVEQAHRIVFGYGTITWEYRLGMRNWLLPLFYTVPMTLGHWLSPDSELYLLLPRLAGAFASLAILWAAYRMGKLQSQGHALIALVAAAFWFEFVMFSAHTLSEPLATAAILAAVGLLYDQAAGRKALALAGFLFGIGILLRFHYALPAAIIALGLCWGSWKARFAPVVLGGLIAAAFGAALDLAMGMSPYSWIVTNIYQNVVLNRSASYGISPPGEYLTSLGVYWGMAALVILPLVLVGYKKHRILIWAAIANLAVHSAIGHKEYRFIFLSTAIFIIVAALASVDVLKWLSARRAIGVAPARLAVLGAIWIGLSVAQAGSPAMKPRWTAYSEFKQVMNAVKTDPQICGIGVQPKMYWLLGAHSKLHRDVPFYIRRPLDPQGTGQKVRVESEPAYNVIIGPEILAREITPDYRAISCVPVDMTSVPSFFPPTATKICAFKREGGCNAAAGKAQEINRWLKDTGR